MARDAGSASGSASADAEVRALILRDLGALPSDARHRYRAHVRALTSAVETERSGLEARRRREQLAGWCLSLVAAALLICAGVAHLSLSVGFGLVLALSCCGAMAALCAQDAFRRSGGAIRSADARRDPAAEALSIHLAALRRETGKPPGFSRRV